MPLVAMLDGQRVDAMKLSSVEWASLQASEDRRRLTMPLCEARAVAKKRGDSTQFFAHYVQCDAGHGPESIQHLAMKTAVAQRIDRTEGWHAIIEFPHPSREWIVDVLAESDDGRRRIAFEVQLSSQTLDRYNERSECYFAGGMFPVWLISRPLEYSRILVSAVVTGFGKATEVPSAVSVYRGGFW